MDVVEGLRALGLTQYEGTVYVHLLGHGPLEARAVSRATGVPSGRIYDALHSLSELGAVEILPGRPKRFHARAPPVALGELLSRKRVTLDSTFDELAREAARLETALAPRAREEPRAAFSVSLGEETGHAFLATQVARARETIDASLRFDVQLHPRDVDVFRALSLAVGRGVRVRAVLPHEDLGRAIESPLASRVFELLGPHLGDGLDVRLSRQAVVPFTVLDRQGVTLPVKNPLQPERYFAFLYVHDPPFAVSLTNKFSELWSSAERGVTQALEAAEMAADSFSP